MKWSPALMLLILSGALVSGETIPSAPPKLKVLTTILPVYCFAVNIAGTEAEVENFLPGGVGPHDYQFTPRDLRKLAEADVIILNGLGLEAWLGRALEAATLARPPRIVEAASGLDRELIRTSGHRHQHGHAHEHAPGEGETDPHVWLDPKLAAHCVTTILGGLIEADPTRREHYERNARAYLERLRRLDSELEAMLAPVQDRPFVVYHDAFAYFVRRYGLAQAGVVEATPDVQPSARHLRELSQLIRTRNVRVMFTEPQFPGRLAAQLSRDLGIRLAELDPIETGALNPGGYEEGMRRNARTLVRYLNE